MFRRYGVRTAAICLVVLTGAVTVPASQQSRPPVIELLDRYANHDFAAVVSLAGASTKDADEIANQLAKAGADWTSAKDARETPGRRLIAATFGLDLARVWSANRFDARWRTSRQLLAWGCAQLRRNTTPLEGERWWHLAAIGIFEGRQDIWSLVGSDLGRPPANWPAIDGVHGHIAHALERFPDEPRFQLARVMARELSRNGEWMADSETRPRSGALPGELTDDYVAALSEAAKPPKRSQPINHMALYRVQQELAMVDQVREVRHQYEALLGVEPIAGEVHLRYAYSTLKLGDRNGGLEHLSHAAALLKDPVLLYTTYLFAGSARERVNQPLQAIAEYEHALAFAPGARSASLALTSLLMRQSRVQEAAAIAEQLLGRPGTVDPVGPFRLGDHRLVSDYLERLKRALP
jgi:hypothetical protein